MAKTNDPALVVAEYNARMPEQPPYEDLARMTMQTRAELQRDSILFGVHAYVIPPSGAIERVRPSELAFDRKTQTYSRRTR